MKLYADIPATRFRQLFTDVCVIAWVFVWITLAMKLFDLIEKLAVPGQKMETAGNGLSDNLGRAGDRIDDVPGVGGSVAAPFRSAADAAKSMANAGRDQQEIVGDVALALSLTLLVLPLGLVLFVWLPLRMRWVRRATSAARLRRGTAGQDLLALRALATQPLGKLIAIDPQIAAAWRRGDPDAVDKLARLELRQLGLR